MFTSPQLFLLVFGLADYPEFQTLIIHDHSVDFPSAVDELSQYVTDLHRVNNKKIILGYVKYYFVLKYGVTPLSTYITY